MIPTTVWVAISRRRESDEEMFYLEMCGSSTIADLHETMRQRCGIPGGATLYFRNTAQDYQRKNTSRVHIKRWDQRLDSFPAFHNMIEFVWEHGSSDSKIGAMSDHVLEAGESVFPQLRDEGEALSACQVEMAVHDQEAIGRLHRLTGELRGDCARFFMATAKDEVVALRELRRQRAEEESEWLA